jgi:dihydroflavonol-4-reductase
MKILLTGATGFVGSHVLRLLVAQNLPVRALKRPNSRMDLVADIAERVEWMEMDITDIALEDAFEGITHVCHCAAVVSFHPKDARFMHRVNVEGTAHLVNLALEKGIQRFVHTSSIAALGRSKERNHLDEKSKWEHASLNTRYAISKYNAEQEVWRAAAEGLTVAIANPGMIVGPSFWDENTARFFTQIKNGLPFCPVGASGFVDVRDVADFLVRLLQSDISDQRYVLVAENWTYRRFFDAIAQELGVKPPGITVQPWLAEIAWRVEWLKEKLTGRTPMVTRESARSSVSSFTYGNEKSLAAFAGFGYRPLSETIAYTAAEFRKK